MGNSPVFVAAGADRFEVLHQAFGLKPIDFKVSTEDTDGGLFIIENGNNRPGGPPRHIHHAQEEWFYVLEGDYVIEVGDTIYKLGVGDAVLAPRAIPHVWAFVGSGRGRLLIVGFASGQIPEIPANRLLLKGCEATGVFWGNFIQREPSVSRDNVERLFSMHARGALRPRVSRTFPLEQASDALECLQRREAIGKLVLVTGNAANP